MPTVRKTTPFREEIDAAIAQINKIITDGWHATTGIHAKLVAVIADLSTARTERAALVTDMAAIRAHLATLSTKLNADVGVTDTDYAVPPTLTSGAPAALTATNPAAVTAEAITQISA